MLTPSQISEMAEKKYPYKSDNPVVMAATDTRRTAYIAAFTDAMDLMSKEWVQISELKNVLYKIESESLNTVHTKGINAAISLIKSLLPEPPVLTKDKKI